MKGFWSSFFEVAGATVSIGTNLINNQVKFKSPITTVKISRNNYAHIQSSN